MTNHVDDVKAALACAEALLEDGSAYSIAKMTAIAHGKLLVGWNLAAANAEHPDLSDRLKAVRSAARQALQGFKCRLSGRALGDVRKSVLPDGDTDLPQAYICGYRYASLLISKGTDFKADSRSLSFRDVCSCKVSQS